MNQKIVLFLFVLISANAFSQSQESLIWSKDGQSFYAIQNGRGCHVISECFLTNEIIEKTLRTNAEDMFRSFNHSMAISRLDGMIGYNINVANAIAGIFAATGQDLASIHESSTAVLQMENTTEGLYVSLTLPNLVVGTVGGGTHLPVASRVLELMGCKGAGKVERFAKLIAGYALGIEISTLAAIVSGQFARAHQKLGRNKPVKWLLRSEVTEDFFKANMPYFHHSFGQNMLCKQLDKFCTCNRLSFGFVLLSICISESNMCFRDIDNPMIGDAYFMGVSAYVFQYLIGSTKSFFGMDIPFYLIHFVFSRMVLILELGSKI